MDTAFKAGGPGLQGPYTPVEPEAASAQEQLRAHLNEALIALNTVASSSGVEAAIERAEDLQSLNRPLHARIRRLAPHVLPLTNGYVIYWDRQRDVFRAAKLSDALRTLGPDGSLRGTVPPAVTDALADWGGMHAATVPELAGDQLYDELTTEIAAAVRQISPGTEVHFVEQLYGQGSPARDVVIGGDAAGAAGRSPVLGLYFDTLDAVAISTDTGRGDPVLTGFHEAFHAIERLLTPEERRLLTEQFGGGGATFNDSAAEAFAAYASQSFYARRDGNQPPGALGPMTRFWGRLNNLMAGRGFRSFDRPEDVFDRIMSGRVAERARPFDVAGRLPYDDAARIARLAGLSGLARTIEGGKAARQRFWKRAVDRNAIAGLSGLASGDGISTEAFYRVLRRHLPDADIRKVLLDKAGYTSIVDEARVSTLQRARDEELRALLHSASSPTVLDLRSGTVDQTLAFEEPGSSRQWWQLSLDEFKTWTAEMNLLEVKDASVKGQNGAAVARVRLAWPAGHSEPYELILPGAAADQKARDEFLTRAHASIVKEALDAGRHVPESAVRGYPHLSAQREAQLIAGIDGPQAAPPLRIEAPVPGLPARPGTVAARAAARRAPDEPLAAWRTGQVTRAPNRAAIQIADAPGLDSSAAPATASREYIVVARPMEPQAAALGAARDHVGHYIPADASPAVAAMLRSTFAPHSAVVDRREWLDVPPAAAQAALLQGASYDRILGRFHVPDAASPELAATLRHAYPPIVSPPSTSLSPTAPAPDDRTLGRARVLYAAGRAEAAIVPPASAEIRVHSFGAPAIVSTTRPEPFRASGFGHLEQVAATDQLRGLSSTELLATHAATARAIEADERRGANAARDMQLRAGLVAVIASMEETGIFADMRNRPLEVATVSRDAIKDATYRLEALRDDEVPGILDRTIEASRSAPADLRISAACIALYNDIARREYRVDNAVYDALRLGAEPAFAALQAAERSRPALRVVGPALHVGEAAADLSDAAATAIQIAAGVPPELADTATGLAGMASGAVGREPAASRTDSRWLTAGEPFRAEGFDPAQLSAAIDRLESMSVVDVDSAALRTAAAAEADPADVRLRAGAAALLSAMHFAGTPADQALQARLVSAMGTATPDGDPPPPHRAKSIHADSYLRGLDATELPRLYASTVRAAAADPGDASLSRAKLAIERQFEDDRWRFPLAPSVYAALYQGDAERDGRPIASRMPASDQRPAPFRAAGIGTADQANAARAAAAIPDGDFQHVIRATLRANQAATAQGRPDLGLRAGLIALQREAERRNADLSPRLLAALTAAARPVPATTPASAQRPAGGMEQGHGR